jgi:hypothetical protein
VVVVLSEEGRKALLDCEVYERTEEVEGQLAWLTPAATRVNKASTALAQGYGESSDYRSEWHKKISRRAKRAQRSRSEKLEQAHARGYRLALYDIVQTRGASNTMDGPVVLAVCYPHWTASRSRTPVVRLRFNLRKEAACLTWQSSPAQSRSEASDLVTPSKPLQRLQFRRLSRYSSYVCFRLPCITYRCRVHCAELL